MFVYLHNAALLFHGCTGSCYVYEDSCSSNTNTTTVISTTPTTVNITPITNVVATTVITFTINSINTCITTTTYTYITICNTINLLTNTIINVVSLINTNSFFLCIISTAAFNLYIPFPSPIVSSVCSGYQPLFNTQITVREWSV
jgi:hypothetical protein